ncbi:hypothetical protein AB0758_43715 [Tolypothrix bouteillei VB521301_2]|uniref:hypothetical protein n=1 Tax=Tolypothrix bouteillei TaxID=1246981 RepID=UPI0038B4E6B5
MAKKPSGWYKQIVRRPVRYVEGYESYEKMCGYVAEIFFSISEQKLRQKLISNPKETINITLYTSLQSRRSTVSGILGEQ